MHRLAPPKFGAKAVFTVCIKQVADKNLKNILTDICDDIDKCDTKYRRFGRSATLFKIAVHDKVGAVSCDDLVKVYTGWMAKKGASGRGYYDTLIASATEGRCPLCGQLRVSTLDHHLPKSEFPSLVVTPHNLVPSCGECNKVKLNALAKSADEQTLHPYFDNTETVLWLKAKILPTSPAAAKFYVDTGELPSNMAKRVEAHFVTFQLATRFALQAANEIMGIQDKIINLLKSGGGSEVKKDLCASANSWSAYKINCWQAALYSALATDDWYCEGGCKAK